jgi:hypothetical protein
MPKENTSKLILTESDVSKLIETRLLRFKHMMPSDFMNTYLVAKSNDSIYQTLSLLRIEELKEILRFLKQEKGLRLKLTGKKQELIERCSKYLYGDYRACSIASISSSPSSIKRNVTEDILYRNIIQILQTSKTISGLIDPRFLVEELMDIKQMVVFSYGSSYHGGYTKSSFTFPITREQYEKLSSSIGKYEVNMHIFEQCTHDKVLDTLPLKVQNWNEEVIIRVNDNTTLTKPKYIKGLQKNRKGVTKSKYVASIPIRLQLQSKISNRTVDTDNLNFCLVEGLNRIEFQTPRYSKFDSIILLTFAHYKTIEELAQQIITNYQESKQHKLNLGEESNTSAQLPVSALATNISTSLPVDEEEDLFVSEEETVPLKDPLSMSLIVHPAKGKHCVHKRCFDLETYLAYCTRTSVWQCPCCEERCAYEDLVIDGLIADILANINSTQSVDKVKIDTKTMKWELLAPLAHVKKEPGTPTSPKQLSTSDYTPKGASSSVLPIDLDVEDIDSIIPVTPKTPSRVKLTSNKLAAFLSKDLDRQNSPTVSLPPLYGARSIANTICYRTPFTNIQPEINRGTSTIPNQASFPFISVHMGTSMDDAIQID